MYFCIHFSISTVKPKKVSKGFKKDATLVFGKKEKLQEQLYFGLIISIVNENIGLLSILNF